MPSPKNATRTMAAARAECIALGIQPGRSLAECERRIAVRKGEWPAQPSDYVLGAAPDDEPEAKCAEAPATHPKFREMLDAARGAPSPWIVPRMSRAERNKTRASVPGGLRRKMQREGRA